MLLETWVGFPGGSMVKNSPASLGEADLILGSKRSLRGGNGKPLHYSCLENSMDRGAWWDTTKRVGHDLMTKPQQRNKSVQITETLLSALWGNTQHWNCCIIWNFCVKIFGWKHITLVSIYPLPCTQSLSHVQLFVTPWAVAHQAPPSIGFSRQEYWSGLPVPSLGIWG